MNPDDRERLQANHTDLLREIDNTYKISNFLHSKFIFTVDDLEEIEIRPTTDLQNQQLLKILPRKGPKAYEHFIEALGTYEKEYLADALKKTVLRRDQAEAMAETQENELKDKDKSQVKQWLIEKCSLIENDANKFKNADVTGEVLYFEHTEGTLLQFIKDIHPTLSRGKISKIMLEVKKAVKITSGYVPKPLQKECVTSPPPPRLVIPPDVSSLGHASDNNDEPCEDKETGVSKTYRAFNSKANQLRYEQGHVFPKAENTRLLDPVHFLISCKGESDFEAEAVRKSAEAICASLNTFQNATLHFGIAPTDDGGTVIGFPMESESKLQTLLENILNCFKDDQQDVVRSLLTEPILVEVAQNAECDKKAYVVELDVEPQSDKCTEVTYLKQLGESKRRLAIFVWDHEKPEHLVDDSLTSYFKSRHILAKARQKAEKDCDTKSPEFYSQHTHKLVDALTLGNGSLNKGLFPILVTNGIPEGEQLSEEYFDENLSFFKDIQWRTIVDADRLGRICNFLDGRGESISIKTLEDIAEKKFDQLLASNTTPWIFLDGYQDASQTSDHFKWKENYLESLREMTNMMQNEVPVERAVIVFILMSENFQILLEMFQEISVKFPNQWCVLCEDADLIKKWNEAVIIREYAPSKKIDEHTISGMPWYLVAENIKLLCEPKVNVACKVPSSHGETILKDKNDFTHLEILSMDECDSALDQLSKTQDISQYSKEQEERFYRGGEVSWWNFKFDGHVCTRDVHLKLTRTIRSALNGSPDKMVDGEGVGIVNLYHQPGAGATTTSKQVLWDSRRQYRCAVVKQLVEGQTSRQIWDFMLYGESNESQAKPVLLLTDNEDAETIRLLRAELEFKAKHIAWDADGNQEKGNQKRFLHRRSCVILNCCRQAEISRDDVKEQFELRHHLTNNELGWFSKKYQELEKNHNDKRGADPRYLISFNILKENFSPQSMKAMTSELVKAIEDPRERKLLMFISLLNWFDPQFRSVPTASFDKLMLDQDRRPVLRHFSFGTLPFRRRYPMPPPRLQWEKTLSTSTQILLNETPQQFPSSQNGLCIINRILSKEIFEALVGGNVETRQTVSEVTMELLENKAIFPNGREGSSYHLKGVREIVRTVLIKRVNSETHINKKSPRYQRNGLSRFSPLIQHVLDEEYVDKAAEILKRGHQLFRDPFIIQQVARLYISSENFEEAKTFANEAKLAKRSSFLYDTYAQVFKQQFFKELTKLKDSNETSPFTPKDAIPAIQIAFQAIAAFREEQAVCEGERFNTMPNTAGYSGELQSIAHLLQYLSYIPDLTDDNLHCFLVYPEYCPPSLKVWSGQGFDFIAKLKSLAKEWPPKLQKLEDINMQLKEDYLSKFQRAQKKCSADEIADIAERLLFYFGEKTSPIPTDLDEAGKCKFRSRRAQRLLGGSSFSPMLKLRLEQNGQNSLNEACKLMNCNRNSNYTVIKDLHYLVCAHMVKCTLPNKLPGTEIVPFSQMRDWSKELYEKRAKLPETPLEVYLFFVMLHWPDDEYFCPPKELIEAKKQWLNAYYDKYPQQKPDARRAIRILTKDKTVYFLTKGKEMERFAHSYVLGDLSDKQKVGSISFWENAEVKSKLQQFEGKLIDESLIQIKQQIDGNVEQRIQIPASQPVKYRSWLHKTVYFYIGFTWSGPRGYYLTITSARNDKPVAVAANPCSSSPSIQKVTTTSELDNITTKLARIETIKKKPPKERNATEKKLVKKEAKFRERMKQILSVPLSDNY